MDGFGAIVVKVPKKGQENHCDFHYSMMRFHTPQQHLKPIRETVFCDSAKTRSQNLINHVEYE